MRIKDGPANLRLKITVTSETFEKVDQQRGTCFHTISNLTPRTGAFGIFSQRPPCKQHSHKELQQQVRLHRLRILNLQLPHLRHRQLLQRI